MPEIDTFRRLLVLLALSLLSLAAMADPGQAGEALARQILERPANDGRVGTMHFELINAAGRTRSRAALMAHSEAGREVRVAIYFTAPAAIQDTAFLSHDRPRAGDATWLYLPVTERVRRLPASERGDYFMGTDLTYGDIKDNFKFRLTDWHFRADGEADHDGRPHPVLLGTARSAEIERETGYGGFRALVDPETWFPVVIEFADPDGAPLKRVTITEQGLVGDAWTALRFEVVQHQTGHTTRIRFEDMRHVPDLSPRVFDANALAFGVPRIR